MPGGRRAGSRRRISFSSHTTVTRRRDSSRRRRHAGGTVARRDSSTACLDTRVRGGQLGATPAWGSVGAYFPDIPDEEQDNFAYPEPLSGEFWGMYAEPAITILNLGVFLLETLRKLNPDYE